MDNFLLTFYNNVYIIILYIIILSVIAIIKFRKNTEDHNIFSGENLFIMFYYLSIAVGPIYLVLFGNYTYNYNVFFIFAMGILCFILGADFIIGNRKIREIRKKENAEVSIEQINFKSVVRNATIVLGISYFCTFIYLLKNVSFIFQDLENNRVIAMQGSGALIHLGYLMLPASWILYYSHLNWKSDKKIYIIYIIDTILLLLLGFRSRIIELLLMMIIIKNDKERFKIKKIVIYGVSLVIIAIALQGIRSYITNGEELQKNNDLLTKTIAVNSINLKSIFQFFPNKVPFQYGYTYLINIIMLKPGPDVDSTLWLKNALNMKFDGGGVTPSILGEFYINFGFIGIFLGMILLGMICRLADRFLANKNNNKILYLIFVFYLARAVVSGISNFLILTIWFMIISYCIFKFDIQEIVKKIKNFYNRTFKKTKQLEAENLKDERS